MIGILCAQCFFVAIHKNFRVDIIDPRSSKTGWRTSSNIKEVITFEKQHIFFYFWISVFFSEATNNIKNPMRQPVA